MTDACSASCRCGDALARNARVIGAIYRAQIRYARVTAQIFALPQPATVKSFPAAK
jgi:hypothetical protein